MKKGERTYEVDYSSLLKGFFCLKNGSFEEGNPGYFKSLVKDQTKNTLAFQMLVAERLTC